MSEDVLTYLLIALGIIAVAWFFVYRAIFQRLRERHEARYSQIIGTAEHRKNGMDRFFGVIVFLTQEDQSKLGDSTLFLRCLALKGCTLLFLLVFLAMTFAPMFLREH
jgi:uncharacterized membrane protein